MAAAPLTLGMRFLLQAGAAATAYWVSHGGISGFGRATDEGDDFKVARCTVGWRRRPTGAGTDPPEDDLMQFGLAWVNVTGGEPDPTWTEADFIALEADIMTWINQIATHMSTHVSLESLTWHLFTPGDDPGNFVRQTIYDPTATINGDESQTPLPPQVACSVSLRTGSRKHWGRFYVPGLTSNALGVDGRYKALFVQDMASYFADLVVLAVGHDFHPVVVSKSSRSALGVGWVACDDIPDIIRRRRWKRVVDRTVIPLEVP